MSSLFRNLNKKASDNANNIIEQVGVTTKKGSKDFADLNENYDILAAALNQISTVFSEKQSVTSMSNVIDSLNKEIEMSTILLHMGSELKTKVESQAFIIQEHQKQLEALITASDERAVKFASVGFQTSEEANQWVNKNFQIFHWDKFQLLTWFLSSSQTKTKSLPTSLTRTFLSYKGQSDIVLLIQHIRNIMMQQILM